MSPLNWQEKNVVCLFGIQTIDLTLQFDSNLKNRVFAGTNATYFPNSMTVSVVGTDSNRPKLHVAYLTPQMDMEVPRVMHYPYYSVDRYQSNGEPLPANTFDATGVNVPDSSTIVNNITLHAIPKRLYIFVAPAPSIYGNENSQKYPNIFGRITNIQMNWNNKAGLLSTATEFDLYRLSTINSCAQAWSEWSKYNGSVLCIDPAKDLGLNALEANGSRGNYQLTYTLRYRSLWTDTADVGAGVGVMPTIVYTIAIQEGYMTVNDSVISLDVGVLTEQSIKDAEQAPAGTYNEIHNMYGGGFFSNLWSGIKKAASYAPKVARVAGDVVSGVAGLIPHPKAQMIGQLGNVASTVGKSLGGKRGGMLSGGARMTKASLMDRL